MDIVDKFAIGTLIFVILMLGGCLFTLERAIDKSQIHNTTLQTWTEESNIVSAKLSSGKHSHYIIYVVS